MVGEKDDGRRGEGNLSNAIQRRGRAGNQGAGHSGPGGTGAGVRGDERSSDASDAGGPRRRRNRAKTGKRSEPGYTMTGAFVRQENYDRVKQLLSDPEVRADLIGELDEWGVRHHPKKVGYSDLVEMLLLEWMDGVERGRGG